MTDDRIERIGLWIATGLGLYVLGAYLAFPPLLLVDSLILAPLGVVAEAGNVGLSVRNALHPVVWGLIVAGVSVPVGRRLVPGIQFSPRGWAILVAGLALSAITTFLEAEFVRARFGYYDPEYVGTSLFAWPALVAIALAGWAALAVPGGRRGLLVLLALAAAAGLALALLPSIPRAADGIDPTNVPLAGAFIADIGYGVAVVIAAALGPRRAAS